MGTVKYLEKAFDMADALQEIDQQEIILPLNESLQFGSFGQSPLLLTLVASGPRLILAECHVGHIVMSSRGLNRNEFVHQGPETSRSLYSLFQTRKETNN
jgi:hypothetical protein